MKAATMSTRKSLAMAGDDGRHELLPILERAMALALGRLEALGHPLLDRPLHLPPVSVSASSEWGVATM